jgi:ABC-2 type transport system ATP-binding protein
MHVPIRALSKGQRKRTLLALGLLAPQPILLIDEPFEGLDLRQSREAAATLRRHLTPDRTFFLSIYVQRLRNRGVFPSAVCRHSCDCR